MLNPTRLTRRPFGSSPHVAGRMADQYAVKIMGQSKIAGLIVGTLLVAGGCKNEPTPAPPAAETSATKPAAAKPATRPAPDETTQAELAKLKGVWTVVEAAKGGPIAADAVKAMRVTIDGDLISIQSGGATETVAITALNPSKSPGWIDVMIGEVESGKAAGIYKLAGDTLSICYMKSDGELRAAHFMPGPGYEYMKLKRQD
jgi:uncharacterized protein (TIGR03067 family)